MARTSALHLCPVSFTLKVFPGKVVPMVLLVNTNHLLKLFDPGSLAQFPLHTTLCPLHPPIPYQSNLWVGQHGSCLCLG